MTPTQLIGYGPFRLEDLQWGEEFCRFDGSLARICPHQPYRQLNPITRTLLLPDHLLVWIHYGTSNATKVLLHRTALAYVLTADQARRIEARRASKKGPMP